ncbi:anti-sigma regulatory factor [Indiicoccus explosivorum]|uniref:anti-sigma regulatory factor n=1 Tax=Indiicoccus explosivorum TaxID=1917864 RepID=UPI000B43A3D9|nr:anti-sigma regulatory factor [Indiicoccus explosivorum]
MESMPFGLIDKSRIMTVISELARNIFNYGLPGKIMLETVKAGVRSGIRLTATDRGPGIPDIGKALRYGYSTSGGLGIGLPGVQKIMDEFCCESIVGSGTNITAVKWF